ncbi:MAG: WbqC family protein [Chitinophagales bacterium]|nr:WbqC family protein [Chitinophagales bacterium]
MSKKNALLIELQYLPAIAWIHLLQQYDIIYLDNKEHYQKGSYRNRCHILGPNGTQRLSIPLVKGKHQHSHMNAVRISYDHTWQKDHWQSICSAYRRSAYFEFYEDVLYPFYHTTYEKLFDFNFALLQLIFKLLKMEKEIRFTETYISPGAEGFDDYRGRISPKTINGLHLDLPVYIQVFSDRFDFHPDLSILDLICNKRTF